MWHCQLLFRVSHQRLDNQDRTRLLLYQKCWGPALVSSMVYTALPKIAIIVEKLTPELHIGGEQFARFQNGCDFKEHSENVL